MVSAEKINIPFFHIVGKTSSTDHPKWINYALYKHENFKYESVLIYGFVYYSALGLTLASVKPIL